MFCLCFLAAPAQKLGSPGAGRVSARARPGGVLYVGLKEGEGEEWVTGGEGYERFFVYYRYEEIDRLILAAGFEIVDGWISPPSKGQRHNWINRFAVAHP